jgi:hypothetical protein
MTIVLCATLPWIVLFVVFWIVSSRSSHDPKDNDKLRHMTQREIDRRR